MDAASLAYLLSLQVALGLSGAAGVRTESRGGVLPVLPGIPPQPTVDLELTPRVTLTLGDRATAITAGYAARLMRRFSEGIGADLLLLHDVSAGVERSFGSSLDVRFGGQLRRGELDFAAAPGLLAGGQAPGGTTSAPAAAIIAMQSLSGSADVGLRIGRSQSLSLGVRATRSDPLASSEAADPAEPPPLLGGAFPSATMLGGSFAYELGLRSGTQVVGAVAFDTMDADIGRSSRGVTLRGSLSHRFGRQLSLTGRLGVVGSALGEPGADAPPLPPGALEGGFNLSPLGGGAINFTPVDSRRLRLVFGLDGGVEPFLNPALGTFEPRLGVTLSVGVDAGSAWSTGLQASFATPIGFVVTNVEPVPAANVDPFVAESLLAVSIPVRRRFLRDHVLEAGLRVGAFGPRFDSPEFQLSNWNAVGFIAIDFNAAWGRRRAR